MSHLCHIITSFCCMVTEGMTIIISHKYTDCCGAVQLLGVKSSLAAANSKYQLCFQLCASIQGEWDFTLP